MKAIRILGPGQVTLQEIPDPAPGPGEVVVRVRATGLCGTDVEIADGTMPYFATGMAQYPITPGHEWAGEVVAVATGATRFRLGDHVVGECSLGCGQCERCRSGAYHLCPQRQETGILGRDGAFAEYLTFPAGSLHRVASSLPFHEACMVEPAAVALHAVRCSGISPRAAVAIYGDGPIGLLAVQMARAYGARRVYLVGRQAARLAIGAQVGADRVINASEQDSVAALSAAEDGQLPEVVIEASGNPEAAALALQSVEAAGRVTLVSLYAGRRAALDLDRVVTSEVTMRGVLGSPGVWPDVIRLLEEGRVRLAPLISHRLPLAAFEAGLDLLRERSPGVVKVVIEQRAEGRS